MRNFKIKEKTNILQEFNLHFLSYKTRIHVLNFQGDSSRNPFAFIKLDESLI